LKDVIDDLHVPVTDAGHLTQDMVFLRLPIMGAKYQQDKFEGKEF
jgi:hypothetical protein